MDKDKPWEILELPLGWEMKFDPAQKKYFFLDHINKTTTWEDPRFTVWNARANSTKNNISPDSNGNLIQSPPPSDTKLMVLNSPGGHVDGDKQLDNLDSLFKTLSLLGKQDTLSPKSSSSAPAKPILASPARSCSPGSSVTKNKTSFSETTSTISNSSEEEKKKADKKGKLHHKQTPSKKKTDRDKKEAQHGNSKPIIRPLPPPLGYKLYCENIGKISGELNLTKKDDDNKANSDQSERSTKDLAPISKGPNKHFARGPDSNLLSISNGQHLQCKSITVQGHNPSLCCGPSPTNACGPNKELLKGPQSFLLGSDST